MENRQFDDLVRSLGERGTRRGAIRLLISGVIAVLAGAPIDISGAKPDQRQQARKQAQRSVRRKPKQKPKQPKCPKKRCPRGYHRNKRTCKCECTRRKCSGGREFNSRSCRCACPRGMRECRDGCISADSCCPGDPPCPEDPKGCCHAPGIDVCTIDGCCRELDGMRACNNFCVDTNTHARHCGDCNVACEPGEVCINGQCGPAECPNGKPACGERCCGVGEECCDGVCQLQGTAVCTKDGWCPTTSGHACCGTGDCADDPCCRFSAGEACCVSMTSGGEIIATCCPGGAGQCAPGGCCPAGTSWTSDLGCNACCPSGSVNCDGCVAPTAGRG